MKEPGLCETTLLDARYKAAHANDLRLRRPKIAHQMLEDAITDMEVVQNWTILADLVDEGIRNGNANRVPAEGDRHGQ